jgi:epoxyqueuosine reductase
VVALSYHFPQDTCRSAGRDAGVIARYARGIDYHDLMWEKLKALGAWIEEAWPGARTRGFADSGPLRERELAARAGMGWQGKHTNLISLDLGNWFLLGALLTTLDLAPDPPAEGHCGTCTRCLHACPTGALVAPHTLDARRCISYLTIEQKGAIPAHLRPLVGARIFGCDDCLAACPWNDRARAGQETRLAAKNTGHAFPDLIWLLDLLADEKGFRAEFAGTPLLRPGRAGLRRNVCVALGNVGGADSIGPLTCALTDDPAPLVRAHAAWALGRIGARTGSRETTFALYAAAVRESDTDVAAEIEAAVE